MKAANRDMLLARIAERLAATGLSERAASLLATKQPDTLRFMRTRGTMPSAARLMRIAEVLEATPEYLFGDVDINNWSNDRGLWHQAAEYTEAREAPSNAHRAVPVWLAIANTVKVEEEQAGIELTTYSFRKDFLGFAAAPAGWDDAELSAFYLSDQAMSPVFEPDVPVVFVHGLEARPGEYGLIFIQDPDRAAEKATTFLVRRIVDISPSGVVLQQLNPAALYQLPRTWVHHTCKAFGLRDYILPPPRE